MLRPRISYAADLRPTGSVRLTIIVSRRLAIRRRSDAIMRMSAKLPDSRDAQAGASAMARGLQNTLAVRKPQQRGFTLVELGVVVVIVSILAMLAVVAYRRLVSSSHTAEATHMIQAIRVAQEAFHAETQQYANIDKDMTQTYPASAPGRFKTAWGGACTNCLPVSQGGLTNGWLDLPVH